MPIRKHQKERTQADESTGNTRSQNILFSDLPKIFPLSFSFPKTFLRVLLEIFIIRACSSGGGVEITIVVVNGDLGLRSECCGIGFKIGGYYIHFCAIVGYVAGRKGIGVEQRGVGMRLRAKEIEYHIL